MTDEEAAEFYYAHRAEPDDAVDSVQLERPRRLSRVVSVRFDPDELAIIDQRAREAGLTMSAYVRQAALSPSALSPSGLPTPEFVMHMVRSEVEFHVTHLLQAVADDVAHIREKIGA